MNAPAAQALPSPTGTVERMPVPQRREQIVVESAIPVLDTAMFDHMMRIANMMAKASLVPAHLNAMANPHEAIANCFLVINQALRWKMDPFAVAQGTFVLKGKLGYEGKLIAAVLNTHPNLVQRLAYKYDGAALKRKVVVSGKVAGDDEVRTVEGTVENWKTNNENWTKNPDQMLAYRGAREWARRWMPEAILGVYADDEVADFESTGRTMASHDQPQQTKTGAAALKAALNAGTDTVEGGNGNDTATGGNAYDPTVAKPAGSLATRDAILGSFGNCSDAEILALTMDGAREYEWTAADQAVLDEAYKKRAAELGGGTGGA